MVRSIDSIGDALRLTSVARPFRSRRYLVRLLDMGGNWLIPVSGRQYGILVGRRSLLRSGLVAGLRLAAGRCVAGGFGSR